MKNQDTMKSKSLILSSTSPYRRNLLDQRGISYQAIAPLCDEEQLKDPSLSAQELTIKLAKAKAESLISLYPQNYIIGADQVLSFKNKIFGKPKTKEKALEQLKLLQGETHQLVTSLFLYAPHKTWTHTEIVQLTMHPWSTEELKSYIELDLPLDCAGSYKLEKKGLILFSEIIAQDYESIIGLPLLNLLKILKEDGYNFF